MNKVPSGMGRAQRSLRQECIEELHKAWLQAIEDKSPGVAAEEVLDRLEQKYQALTNTLTSVNSMDKMPSKTDWKRIQAHNEDDPIPFEPGDGPYDPNDAEAVRAWLTQADLVRHGKVVRRGKRGPQKTPTKTLVSLRLSPEVIDHFKATGPGWQTRIDRTLRASIKKQA